MSVALPPLHRAPIAHNAERFASAILLRPFQVRKGQNDKNLEPEKTAYEIQVEVKKRFRAMLENEKLVPRVQKINSSSGAPPADRVLTGINLLDSMSEDDASEQSSESCT